MQPTDSFIGGYHDDKKTILLLIIMSMVLTVCFPADVLDAQAGKTPEKEIPLNTTAKSAKPSLRNYRTMLAAH